MKKQQFQDDAINVITNDITRLRTRPTQFIAGVGETGVLQLCKEMIDNNRDECSKPESSGNTIDIVVTDKWISSADNGRGIPTNMLQVIHETMQAGSNMVRAHGSTVGENGLGTTAYTALASDIIITTTRPQEKKKLTLHYKEGDLQEKIEEDYFGDEHGMYTKFKPSKKILGIDTIPVEALSQWIKDFDYTLDPKIHVNYTINNRKYQTVHKSLHQFITDKIEDKFWMCNPITFSFNGKFDEEFNMETFHRTFNAEVCIMYTNPDYKGDDINQSWVNKINTKDGGSHVNGIINGISKYLTEKITKKNSRYKDEDFKRDIKSHLNIVIKLECDLAHMFASQSKLSTDSDVLYKVLNKAVYEALDELKTSYIDDMVECILTNHRMRKAGEQAKDIRAITRTKGWKVPDSYLPCASTKTKEKKELFIVEGKSARGGLRAARNASFQAIIMNRGKLKNTWDSPLEMVLKNEILRNLVNVMGGIGPTFDINKLIFDKIIITTDADIDGFHIRTGIESFYLKWYPEVIDAGKLYIAEPPLYRLYDGKKYYYVATQNEYIDACINSIGDLSLYFPSKKLTIDASEFVSDAFNYLSTLREISINRSVKAELIEYIANGFTLYGNTVKGFIDNVPKWLRSLVKIYPELTFDYNNNEVKATIDLRDQVVVIDDNLLDALKYIIEVQTKYGLIVEYTSKRNNIKCSNTLSTFFVDVEKYYPTIKDRFKGLGSSPAAVSREVIMNPDTRRLIRLTRNDVETNLKFAKLVGEGKENINNRKEMLLNFEFTKNDIDT